MRNFIEVPSVRSHHLVLFTDQLRLAVAAYLAGFDDALIQPLWRPCHPPVRHPCR